MNVTVTIPDGLAARIGDEREIGRRALEGLGLREYSAGRMTKAELGRLLGFETRHAIDGFLRASGVFQDITLEEIQRDLDVLRRLDTHS